MSVTYSVGSDSRCNQRRVVTWCSQSTVLCGQARNRLSRSHLKRMVVFLGTFWPLLTLHILPLHAQRHRFERTSACTTMEQTRDSRAYLRGTSPLSGQVLNVEAPSASSSTFGWIDRCAPSMADLPPSTVACHPRVGFLGSMSEYANAAVLPRWTSVKHS